MMEGSGISRLTELFEGNNGASPLDIRTATIKSLPPNPAVQVDGDSVDTPSEGIIIAEHLTEHKRTVTLAGEGGRELTFNCDLKVGDRVIVAVANDGQLIYVIDKAVV